MSVIKITFVGVVINFIVSRRYKCKSRHRESFLVNPRPDGGVPVHRHNQSTIDDTRALIGRGLVLMTLNPFEHVAVSLKLVSMLLDYSSPPASLVFAVFSCEQIIKRMEFEL